MPDFHPTVSPSAEEYLLTLFRMECQGERAGTSRLAKQFNVKAPSVTGMLRRLHSRGWVYYRRYRPPELTEEGRELAVRLIRRHRLLESFLVKFLLFEAEESHHEVQILQHSVSEKLLRRIDASLGHPAFDPNGEAIPDEHGNIPERPLILLTKLEAGKTAFFSRVDNRNAEIKFHLSELDAYPGMAVTMVRPPKSGKVTIRVGDSEFTLEQKVAEIIYVQPNRVKVYSGDSFWRGEPGYGRY